MPKIVYTTKRFSEARIMMIDRANQIIDEYEAQGFTLTLRQVYYQFVSRGWLPNMMSEYKRLGETLNDARLAGRVDWLSLEDRTRYLRGVPHQESPWAAVDATAQHYRIDKWADQSARVEVWVEKDALVGVIEPVCVKLDVDFFSCRGYTSQSECWRAAQRLKGYQDDGQNPVILHLGDHDPSGCDMTRDILDRLELFLGGGIEVKRLALNMDQVERYGPPPNPAKITDSRARAYIAKYGRESWELDALEPTAMAKLIEDAVLAVRDEKRWRESVAREKRERARIAAAAADLRESLGGEKD